MVVNGRPISEDDRIVMRRDINLISVHAKRMKEVEKTLSTSPLDLFRKKYQKRTLILFILWFASVVRGELTAHDFIVIIFFYTHL